MRRFTCSILIVSLTASLVFATSKPSLDGRAVVAGEGVLPAGLFAKTVGYLPGDSVSVTNPATGITINVLILGSIDPSAGVAILLSPEAADKLFITPESNTQVKITKRTGMLDESVSGSGTVVSSAPTDALPDSLAENLDARLGAVDAALGTPVVPAEPAPEKIAGPETPPAQTNEAETALAPPPAEPASEETGEASRYTVTSVEEVPMNHVLAENDPVYIVEVLGEEAPEPVVEPEMEPIEAKKALAAADEAGPEMEPAEDDPALVDPFAPIILVPAGENPPEEDVAKDEPIPIKPKPIAPVVESVAKLPAPSGSLGTDRMVKTLDQLESGKYYVQVATFAEQENIDKMLKDYGSKYPFVMVPLKNGKAVQMMVGPLNVDEYGAVLARFKSLGFNDSFLRKIR